MTRLFKNEPINSLRAFQGITHSVRLILLLSLSFFFVTKPVLAQSASELLEEMYEEARDWGVAIIPH